MLAPRPRPSRSQQLLHEVVTVPPPTRGINANDAVAAMAPDDALQFDNFISGELGVAVREGWYEYAINVDVDDTHPVRTVMPYNGAPATSMTSPLVDSELFAATDNGIWLIEGGGDFAAAAAEIALSGSTNAGSFSHAMFTAESGGQYLVACSETDGGYLYDGVSWMKMTSVGAPGPGIITGIDPADFVQVCVWKKRLLFVERTSGRMWTLDVGAVGGIALEFDFGPLLQNGGALAGLASWTQDAGAGIDDRLVVFGSSGDLAVYEGTDPTDATKFSNVGVWFIGQPPIGRRFFTTSGGNVFVLTVYGLLPVAGIVQGGLDNVLTSDTDEAKQLRKLQDLLHRDFVTLLNTDGWELASIPSKAFLHIVRPPTSVDENVEYVFQEHSRAWSRIVEMPVITVAKRLNEVYGGTADGRVLRIYDGFTDGMDIAGDGASEIRSRLTPAFQYFGNPAVLKQALMMRVNFLSRTQPSYTQRMNVNFAINTLASAPAVSVPSGAVWDAAFWDTSFWAGAARAFGEWRSVEGMGYSLAPSLFVTSQDETVIANIEYMMKSGGPL